MLSHTHTNTPKVLLGCRGRWGPGVCISRVMGVHKRHARQPGFEGRKLTRATGLAPVPQEQMGAFLSSTSRNPANAQSPQSATPPFFPGAISSMKRLGGVPALITQPPCLPLAVGPTSPPFFFQFNPFNCPEALTFSKHTLFCTWPIKNNFKSKSYAGTWK